MTYTIHELAELAEVSVHALYYYDKIGLLQPPRNEENDYREYGEQDLLMLQQILFFREMDFALADIRRIIYDPEFNMKKALEDQRHLVELKKKRYTKLLKTIDLTLRTLNKETKMQDEQLYDGFDDHEQQQYAEEVKQRWGATEAYRQSQEQMAKMSKPDMERMKKDSDTLMHEIVVSMHYGPGSVEVQALIARHYDGLRHFYEPTPEMYRGLAQMYISDERFKRFYEKYAPDLAQFMHDAMLVFAGEK